LAHFFTQERVRYLYEYSCAITCERIGANCATMGQVLKDLQALFDYGMGFFALNMRNKSHAACVVLVGRVVEALNRGRMHRIYLWSQKSRRISAGSDCENAPQGFDYTVLQARLQGLENP